MDVVYKGTVSTTGGTRIECVTTSLIINTIIINNTTSNYVFGMGIYMDNSLKEVTPIYNFTLEEGDSLRDDEQYILVKGNYIEFTSDVPGTTYYVKAKTI